MNDASLKVEGVSKIYGRTLLFENISFSMQPGEVVSITGWNGSGKSTLVRMIAGLITPSAGRIVLTIDGDIISKTSRRKYLGLAAPAISLYEELTGLENLEFFCKVRRGHLDRSNHLELMAWAGLNGQQNKSCGDYSSGMKQRLKLVQALIHSPILLLLDEPGTNLDSEGLKLVARMVQRQRETGMTIIASNDKREVQYADRIINLSE